MFYLSAHKTPYALTHRKGDGGMVVTAMPAWIHGRLVLTFKCKLYSPIEGLKSDALVDSRPAETESVGNGALPLSGNRYTLVYVLPGTPNGWPSLPAVVTAFDQIGLDLGFASLAPTAAEGLRDMIGYIKKRSDALAEKVPSENTYFDMKSWVNFLKTGTKAQLDPDLPPEIAALFKPKG